jgi:pre-mRNA-splicing factor ATP-dependent RNA helicase DHX15/PRP43
MSATLEIDKFCKYFGTESIVKVEGRAHPIEVYHTMQPQKDYLVIFHALYFDHRIHWLTLLFRLFYMKN